MSTGLIVLLFLTKYQSYIDLYYFKYISTCSTKKSVTISRVVTLAIKSVLSKYLNSSCIN